MKRPIARFGRAFGTVPEQLEGNDAQRHVIAFNDFVDNQTSIQRS